MRNSNYDENRLAEFKVVKTAVGKLQLPLMRQRNLISIMNAVEVQIEGGSGSPEVETHLLRALQAAVRYEVVEGKETAVLQAINSFAKN